MIKLSERVYTSVWYVAIAFSIGSLISVGPREIRLLLILVSSSIIVFLALFVEKHYPKGDL